MADWRVRGMAVVVAAGWFFVACGSRTGDYWVPGVDGGSGIGSGGVSGVNGVGGATSAQASGTGVGPGTTLSGATVFGAGATFGMGFSASSTAGPSSFISNTGFVGITAVSGSVFGSNTVTTTTGMTTSGVGGASGSCCERSSAPSCEDPDVAACVCNIDPFCCKYVWDGFCVEEVEALGCGTCDAGVGGATTGVTGTSSTSSAVTGVGGASASSTTGEGGSGGVAECIAQSRTDCEACLCSDCFEAYGDCVGDFGCPRILECMDATGCTGLDCYAPDACQTVIDRFGGLTGASVAYVTGLVACAIGAECPCG